MDVVGDWAAVGGGMGSRGSWLFHTSQCKALQVCSERARELGQGLRLGHRHRWCRDCIHEGEWAVGVMAVGSPEWSGPDRIGSRYSRADWL